VFIDSIYDVCGLLEEGSREARRYVDAISPTEHSVGEEVKYDGSDCEILATFYRGPKSDRYALEDENGEIYRVSENDFEV